MYVAEAQKPRMPKHAGKAPWVFKETPRSIEAGGVNPGPEHQALPIKHCNVKKGKKTMVNKKLAQTFTITGRLLRPLRYGENPQQKPAGVYIYGNNDPLAIKNFNTIEGEPGFVNTTDWDRLLATLTKAAAVFHKLKGSIPSIMVCVKHGNACGANISFHSPDEAVRKAVTGDTRAAFGGSVMCNFKLTKRLATSMVTSGVEGKQMFDCVTAPGFDKGAIEVLSRKGSRCKLVENPALAKESDLLYNGPLIRPVRGGFLVQPSCPFVLDFDDPDMEVFGRRDAKLELDLAMAWAIGSTSNSNTISIVKDLMLIADGVGQHDRVGAAELAVKRARDAGHKVLLKRAAAYSDSFFPFPDGPKVLIEAGIKAIFTTSGSIRDEKTIELCKKRSILLYMIPDRKARGFACY